MSCLLFEGLLCFSQLFLTVSPAALVPHSSEPSLCDATANLGGKSPRLQRRRFKLTEKREGESLGTPKKLALRMLGSFFQSGRKRGLNGDAVLNEGRVQVNVGQRQALVPLPDVPGDLGQAALEGGDAPLRGLLGEVLVRVGAQRPLGGNQVRGQDGMENNQGATFANKYSQCCF